MLDQPLGAAGCRTIESSFCRTTPVVVPVPFGHLWDFLVHPQASASISSWAVPVLQTKDSSSMEKLLAGRKKIKELSTREGIMLSSSVEEREVKVMMRNGQEPTLLV